METIKDIAQIIFYLSLSISGPLAVYEYLKVRKADRQAREYQVYNELDNRLFEYQKLALQYADLDILDLPGKESARAVDKKRKQELIAHAMLFSLFERAYLMFNNQTTVFKDRQWSGWKLFLDELLHRESVQVAWQLSKHTYDTDFQSFMEGKIEKLKASAPQPPGLPGSPAEPTP
jgi:hypothetical protein